MIKFLTCWNSRRRSQLHVSLRAFFCGVCTAHRSEASSLGTKVNLRKLSGIEKRLSLRFAETRTEQVGFFSPVAQHWRAGWGRTFWHLCDGRSEEWSYWVIWVSIACAAHSGAARRIFSKRLLTWKHRDWICLSHVGRGSRAETLKKEKPEISIYYAACCVVFMMTD